MTMWVSLPCAVGAWAAIYIYLRKAYPNLGPEWSSRVVTLLHALIIVPCCAYASFIVGPSPFTDPGGPNSDLQDTIVLVSLSYFIFDFFWSLSSGTEGPVMLAHHVLSIFGNWVTIVRGTCGTEMCATLFGAEISNPFLQVRYFLRQSNLHRTWYGELNDVGFMFVFGFMRLVVGSYFMYCYLPHPEPDWIAKTGGFTLYCMGWIWWFAIVRYAIKKYTKMYKEYMEIKKDMSENTDVTHTHTNDVRTSASIGNGDIQNGINGSLKNKED